MAVAVLQRVQWRVPVVYSQADVLALIERCAGDKLSQAEKDALRNRLTWLQKKRRKTVVSRTALDRRVLKAHNRIEVSSLDEIDITKLRGVVLVKTPMGSGKTQKIGRPFIDEAKRGGGTVMAIAHRISLISELAARLGLPNYQIVTEGEIEDAGGVAVCLPSTARNDIRDAMPSAEYMFIDEIAQVLRYLADSETCGAGEADNKAIYHRLMQIVRDAVAVVVADADLDMRTLSFLEKARPGERFTVVEMKAKPNSKAATVYHKMAATYDDITIELMNGGKVWCACESKFRAEEMARQFAQRGFKTIAITARTKNNPEVMAFLQNAEEQSRLYDLVVASPAISSGLSIEHKGDPHFTLGAFIGAGMAIRPEDARQMVSRVRYLKRYSIAIERTNAQGGQTAGVHRQGAESAAALEGLEIEWTGFDQYVAQIKAEDANAKADFGAGMWFGLEEAGWTLERGVCEGHEAAEEELNAARAEYTEARIAALLAAEPMTKDLADAARKMVDRPLDTDIGLEAHNIRIALGKLDLTAEDIVFWANGRGAEKIARFEDLVGADVDVPAEHGSPMQRKYRTARRKLFDKLFEGFHLDQVFTRADQKILLDRIMAQPEVFATVGIVGPKFRASYRAKDGAIMPMKRPKHPAREVREILERCGLSTKRKQSRSVSKQPSLVNKEDDLMTESDRETVVNIVPESLAYMRGILARCENFDIDQVIAEREQSLVNVHQAPALSENVIVSTVLTKQVSNATGSAFGAVRDVREKSTVKNALGFRSGAVGLHAGQHKLQTVAAQQPAIDMAAPLDASVGSNVDDEELRMRQWCASTEEIVREVFERSRYLSPYDPDAWL
jgi:putative DNA primase/helicase